MIKLNNILESGHDFSDNELSLKFKFRLINTIMIIIVFTSTVFGTLHYLGIAPLGDFHANVNFAFAFFNLLFLFWLRRSKEAYDIVVILMLISALLTFTSALITIPNDEFRIVWFYITIFLAFFAGGVWHGYATAFASILIILITNTLYDLNLSGLAISTAITGIIILTIAVKSYTQKMIDLEDSLHTLNDNLHLKVKSAVAEARNKDKFMIQQARMAQMGEMIAMIAHQWRQPLSSISAISTNLQLTLALEQSLSSETLDKNLKIIDERIVLLSNTIDDFRNFYNTNNDTNHFDLAKTISQAIDILSPAVTNADVSITFTHSLSEHVESIESEIIQVLMNLIKNAIDILKEQEGEREITITASQNKEETAVVVEDSGGGIDNKIINKVFDPYFSTKKEKHGMGLGLYMSKLIIQEHCGGKLDVVNGSRGACFTITIPRSEAK